MAVCALGRTEAACSGAVMRAQAVAKAMSSSDMEWPRVLTSVGKLTGRAVELKGASSSATRGRRPSQEREMMLPQPAAKPKEDQAISVELLGGKLFSDPSQWWGDRFGKNSPASRCVRLKRTKEPILIEGWASPPWVKTVMSGMIQSGGLSGDGFSVNVHHEAPRQEYIRVESGISAMTTSFEQEPREEVEKKSSCSCGDIRRLCNAGQLEEELHLLNQGSISAASNTYVQLLQECIKIKGLAEGKQVHRHMMQNGLKPNMFLLNTLVNMYMKCGSMADAQQVFDKLPERDLFTWTIMIAGYSKHGYGREAFEMYEHMLDEGVMPNRVTFICILNACASLSALEKGKEVHAEIMKSGIVSDIILETALTNMYAKCGSMKDAHQVFDNMAERNVVSWTVMIAGFAQHGCAREAFEIYDQMILEGVTPNMVTFTCILNACASLRSLAKGKKVHADIIKAGIPPNTIMGTALADMYAKCGSLKDARDVFDNMAERNVVSWNAMIAGYAQHGCGREAFDIYKQMVGEGVTPNKVTFICTVNACASLAALEMGKEIHADVTRAGIAPDVTLENALVDMYAKCGSIKDARQVFDKMAKRNVASSNVLIAGYTQHGCGREALEVFEQMQQACLKPNAITFISLLSTCSYMGLVEEGHHYFASMSRDHGLTPAAEHFGCLVDLLGRAGRLDEAEDFINRMPIEPGAGVWVALLGSCRIHGDMKRAERAAKCILKWDAT